MQRKYLNRKGPVPGAMPMSAWAWLHSMPTKTWPWHPVLAVLVMLATLGGTGRADSPPAKTDPPQPLPKNIVTAWKESGAEVCWLRVNQDGSLEYVGGKEGKPGDLPAFRFAIWQERRLSKLPAPASAFGLDLGDTEVTDVGLKELAQLKSLQALNLNLTEVTDAGLKELARLKSLQALDLSDTQVTDAGLKELARLKSLQALGLSDTQVTDAGLKVLTGLKSLQTLDLTCCTQVTDAGLKELQKALPRCRIIH